MDGSGYADGFNKKGLYINSDTKKIIKDECLSKTDSGYINYDMEYREDDTPIITNALTYREYFNTLEIVLNWAVYYTACAMKWSLDQAKKQGLGENLEAFNPNQWVNSPHQGPIELPDPTEEEEDQLKQEKAQANGIHIESWFIMAAIIAPIVIPIVLAPKAIDLLKKEKDLTVS
ncbi:MAG: hypothetical protein ACFFAO_15790 [Candidatus Hermodarchaeota archaeon]